MSTFLDKYSGNVIIIEKSSGPEDAVQQRGGRHGQDRLAKEILYCFASRHRLASFDMSISLLYLMF